MITATLETAPYEPPAAISQQRAAIADALQTPTPELTYSTVLIRDEPCPRVDHALSEYFSVAFSMFAAGVLTSSLLRRLTR